MGSGTSLKCLDCGTVLKPSNKWEQCECGHLFIDHSAELLRWGALDEERVQLSGEFNETEQDEKLNSGKTRQRPPRRVSKGDQWTGSETGL